MCCCFSFRFCRWHVSISSAHIVGSTWPIKVHEHVCVCGRVCANHLATQVDAIINCQITNCVRFVQQLWPDPAAESQLKLLLMASGVDFGSEPKALKHSWRCKSTQTYSQSHTHTACGTFHTQREAETRADKHAYGLPIEQLTLWAICFGHTLIWLWPAKSNAGAMKN